MIMGKFRPFRYWYYFRQGYQLYFAFIFAGINTLVVTYYLAIERAPVLKEIFPSFPIYAAVLIAIGLPALILAGFIHFKRIPAFKSEQEVTVESNPFIYKLPPGHARIVGMPYNLLMSKLLARLLEKNDLLTDEEAEQLKEIQKNMKKLINGEFIGAEGKRLPFSKDKD